MNNTITRITAILFAIMMLLPTFGQVSGLSAGFSSTENRQLKEMPALNFPHVRNFSHQFDQYYKESFGWRNALFYVYSRWKFKVLRQSPLPEKVVIGKNGWLYLGNSYNRVVDQHRGFLPLSADSARIMATHLASLQQELARQGTRLYVFVAPDSHSIYPEYLPNQLQASTGPSRLDVLKAAMQHTNVPFVDIRDTLRAAKKDNVVYYQTDTHWNDYGTLVGCAALLNRIRQDLPMMPPVRQSDFHIEKQRGLSGDLSTMLMLQEQMSDPVYYYIKPIASRAGKQTAVEKSPKLDFPSTRFAGPATDRLLFIGDSFSHSMMAFLPGYFRESYFIRDSKLDPAVLRVQQPAVVVIEIVERNIDKLATF
ncbi:alginate O-acetyltransferase AlgX-related protein [Spirosoma areae]